MALMTRQKAKSPEERANIVTGMKTFFVEVRAEIKKIVWPTREVLIQATLTVVIITLALTVYMGVMDLTHRKLYDAFEKLG